MKTSLLISILLVVVVLGGGVFLWSTLTGGSTILGPLGDFFPISGDKDISVPGDLPGEEEGSGIDFPLGSGEA